jgi:hypothetical protein
VCTGAEQRDRERNDPGKRHGRHAEPGKLERTGSSSRHSRENVGLAGLVLESRHRSDDGSESKLLCCVCAVLQDFY